MSFEVLQSMDQVHRAREIMKARGISQINSNWQKLLRKLHLSRKLPIGEEIKSWDVLRSVQFVEERLPRNASILDIGCFCSEILPSLHDAGYDNLAGVDLNPDVQKMPCADIIDYREENFFSTSFEDGRFDAIISISVIEHGYDPEALLAEVSRLLKPGGYFLASFDYWPDKVDTVGAEFFDMSWRIFSRKDVDELFAKAANWGLFPVGELRGEANERVVSCLGFKYSFGWLAMAKRDEQ